MILCKWVSLLRLARRRFQGWDDYHQFQVYQGQMVLDYLAKHGVSVRNAKVLDLGCGAGGYSRALASAGAHVVSIDLVRRPKTLPPPIFVLADAVRLPFTSGSFPMVFCTSLIEHIPHPDQLMAEIRRVLVPDGVAYVSFPPFFSPVGGHQFKPYHLLGERWALRLSQYKADGYATCYGDWGLYPLTIRRARQLIAADGLIIKHESTRFFPLNVARLPWLGEFLTWHVQFIVQKGK
jgi:SAM-dependent methyltransferase